MKRRTLVVGFVRAIAALPLLLASIESDSQPTAKVPRIGFLCAITCGDTAHPGAAPLPVDLFKQALETLGYVDGRNIKIEYLPPSEPEDGGRLARELVQRKVDLLFVVGETLTALAARKATATIPIVIAVSGDPVAAGLAQSLARPGGSVTGVTYLRDELAMKGLELLRDVVPGLSRVAVVLDSTEPAHAPTLKNLATRAPSFGMVLRPIATRPPTNFASEFASMVKDRVDGVVLLVSSYHFFQRSRVAYLTLTSRLPSVSSFKEFAEVGGLMAYSPGARDLLARAAAIVDKVLKGAKPGDLPIEQPTKFEFVINLKTAKALGLTIPSSVLARADEVIQ